MFNLNLGALVVHLTANDVQFKKIMARTQGTMKRAGDMMSSMGRKLSMYVTAPLVAMAAVGVKAFAEFDDAMTQSIAIMSGVTLDLRKEMEATAKEISGRSITTAQDLAKSYYYLASAGLDVKQSIGALPVVERFAVAGMFNMAQATELLMDAQAALGLKMADAHANMMNATRVSDILVRANTIANASVQQFSEALTSDAGAAIKNYNMDLEEGMAILAAYADQGMKGNVAGTSMARMVRFLIKSINENRKVFTKMNIDVEEFAKTGKNVTGVIEGISKAVEKMGPAEKAAALEALGFQARTQQVILPLLGATARMKEYQAALKSASGYTKDVANKQLASFSSQMKILWNTVKNAAEEIGRVLSPFLIQLGEKIKKQMDWWKGLDESTKRWIIGAGAAAAAVGPLLIVMGQLSFAISNVSLMLSKAGISGLLWVGVAGLVAASVLMLTDALLQFFDVGNLGIVDLVASFRIGGYKIATWMDMVVIGIAQGWDWCVKWAKLAWASLVWELEKIGGQIWRIMLRVGQGIADGFYAVVKKVVDAFAWMADKVLVTGFELHLIDEDSYMKGLLALQALQKGTKDFANEVSNVYEKQIAASLSAAEQDYKDYYSAISGYNKDYEDQAKAWEEMRDKLFMDDMNAQFEVARKAASGAETTAKTAETAAEQTGKTPGGPTWSKTGFKEVNLNRFSLATPAGVSSAAEKTTVKAPELEEELGKQTAYLQKIATNLTLK